MSKQRSIILESPDATVGIALDGEIQLAQLKLQSSSFELNVFLNVFDVKSLNVSELPLAPDQTAICAGESCGAPAHWSRGPEDFMAIVIGFDDTNWDFAVFMPYSEFDKIKNLLLSLVPTLELQSDDNQRLHPSGDQEF